MTVMTAGWWDEGSESRSPEVLAFPKWGEDCCAMLYLLLRSCRNMHNASVWWGCVASRSRLGISLVRVGN